MKYTELRTKRLELGWILHPAYHGRGYISEAAKAVIEFAKTQFGVCHFIAHCDTEKCCQPESHGEAGTGAGAALRRAQE